MVALIAVVLAATLLVLAVPQPVVIAAAALLSLMATIALGRRADETMLRRLRERASR